MTKLYKNQAFTVAHADDGKFAGQGLRPFFEYRDLGIKDGTKGKFGAHVIRAVPGMESPAEWHSHDLDFQMVYITKGWVVFEYEGQGEQMLREGSCVLQPPGIKHREVRHSDDMELIEIISPAEFDTADETAP
jgi:mannose-6-phosphate isomerase-like protein (cupin superfamily)